MEREFYPEQIVVIREAEVMPSVGEIVAQWPEAEVVRVDRIGDIRAPDAGLKAGIESGKRTLVVARSRKFVERFVNSDPGAVCPTFAKLTPATHCPFDCQFCFLQGTYRALRPWVCLHTDVSGMLSEVDNAVVYRDAVTPAGERQPLVFNAGEMCDSLATVGLMPGLLQTLVAHFAQAGNDKLLLLTKSAKVDALLGVEHRRNTIVSWSLNGERVAEVVEVGTASLGERLVAARKCQEAGYRVRFRFDPLIYLRGWREQYADMVERTMRMVRPERITLGSFRLLGNLRSIIAGRFPDSDLLDQPLEREPGGKRWRYSHEIRREMYEFVIGVIRGHAPGVTVSICKETPRMWADLRDRLTPGACNCLP